MPIESVCSRIIIARSDFYTNLSSNFPDPNAVFDPTKNVRCPVCGGQANLVLGQPDFISSNPGITSQGMNLPTAVASDGVHLAVADTSNNRVLLWNTIPTQMDQKADVVIGQKDFTSLKPVVA